MIDHDLILGQMQQAFGQGAGSIRVSRKACAAFSNRYSDQVHERYAAAWADIQLQLLERIRAIGRLAAHKTIVQGKTFIGPEALITAAIAVEEESMCPWCPTGAYLGGTSSSTAREDIMAQFHMAFGQGCGAIHVPLETVSALRDRYATILTDEVLAGWDSLGVQMLERIRAVGRLAFHRAAEAGQTVITPAIFLETTRVVEYASECPHCPVWLEARAAA